MSMKPHGRGFHRGGYGHQRGGQWGGHQGSRRGGGGGRGEYHHIHGGRSTRPLPPRHRHNDPEELLASLGPDAQLALTTALINTVLKTNEEKESRGSFREGGHEAPYRHREQNKEVRTRGAYYREEMQPRRQYPTEAPHGRYESHWSEDGGRQERDQQHHHLDWERFNPQPHQQRHGNRYQHQGHGNKRRLSPPQRAHQGPYKRQRMEMSDERPPHHYREEEEEEEDYPEEREGSGRNISEKWGIKRKWHRGGGERRPNPSTQEDREPRERSRRSESEGRDGGKDADGGGVQVTIRADGERAVNSDGLPRRVAGRLFVDLRCPHCPNQKSITFKEYKLHLASDDHKTQLYKLAQKRTAILRFIRHQQRNEQKEIEDKWMEENPEEFKAAVSRFCNTCKLAFKSDGKDSTHCTHKKSKLHRKQSYYFHPRCGFCHKNFMSRMIYEHHIASIKHLRVRTMMLESQGGEVGDEQNQHTDELTKEDDQDDLDLANFLTLDSVGDDATDNEDGSEHKEIIEGLEAVEAAEKEAANGDDSEEEMEGSGEKHHRSWRGKDGEQDEEDNEKSPLPEIDWEKEQHEEEEEEGEYKSLGKEYVQRMEAYYCSLCFKVIRADQSMGSRAVQRHCRSLTHLSNYWDQHPGHNQEEDEGTEEEEEVGANDEGAEDEKEVGANDEGAEDEEEVGGAEDEEEVGANDDGDEKESLEGADDGILGLDGDQEQDKLWDEVDKGLSELRGEILTEIGESDKENGTKDEEQEKAEDDVKAVQEQKSEEDEEEKTKTNTNTTKTNTNTTKTNTNTTKTNTNTNTKTKTKINTPNTKTNTNTKTKTNTPNTKTKTITKTKVTNEAGCEGQGATDHSAATNTTEAQKDAWEEVGEDFIS